MATSRLPLYLFVIIGVCSFLYQWILSDVIYVQKGVGRKLQPISEFPYTCRRISDPGFEACEDMWISERTRQLFLACSDSLARKHWMPNIARLDASKRSLKDKVIVLDLDDPVGDSFSHRVLATSGYSGINGDGKLSLVALTGVDYPDHIDLYLNNNRPSIDVASGQLLDNEKVGANSTIELFRISDTSPATKADHIKTFVDEKIATPNRIAPTGSGSFYFTNDHGSSKFGLWHELSPLIKNGDVSFCTADGACKRVDNGFAFPNGLHLGRKDGLLYVPSTISGRIVVYKQKPDGGIERVDEIKTGYPLDNISEDNNGDYFVAAFPKMDEALGTFDDPLGDAKPGATVFRIRRRSGDAKGYEVTKMLEDSEGEVLPATTTVVHDVKTGRLFLSSVVAPYVVVCERKTVAAT